MRRWEIGVVFVLGVILSLIYYYPILHSGNNLGIQDWDQNFAWTEATRVSLLDYHQLPLWNPYKCGGSVQFANPQIAVISLQTVLALLFGTIRGIKLSIFIHGIIGFIGFFFLARQYKLSFIGSLLSSLLFSFSGITASFLSTGMVVFTSFAYSPFILYFFNKSFDQWKWGLLSGALFALSFYSGYHIALLLGIYLLVFTIFSSITSRSFTPFKEFLIVFITSAVLILPKLILSIQLIRIFPHPMAEISGYTLHDFFYFLLSQKQNLFNEMNVQKLYFAIDENSLYVGILPIVFFLLSFISNKSGIKNHAPLLLSLVVMIWFMLGNILPPSLYALIKQLPVFSSFRVAQRFRFDFIIPFALLAGLGLDNGVRLLKGYHLPLLMAVFCLVIVYVNLTVFSSTNFLSKTLIINNLEAQLTPGYTFIQTDKSLPDFTVQKMIQLPEQFSDSNIFGPWSLEYLKIKEDEGVIQCYDSITSTINAVGFADKEYQGEYYLSAPAEGVKIQNILWSPNRLSFKITGVEKGLDDTLVINQNYFPGWMVMADNQACKRAISYNGLLAARLDSQSGNITFEFNPFLRWFVCRN
jgi:hypothetical protein